VPCAALAASGPKVPGFSLGFGNHTRAREYLQKALEINPAGIDPNFFYGELMFKDGDYAQALRYLQKVQNAVPRPERRVARGGNRSRSPFLQEDRRAHTQPAVRARAMAPIVSSTARDPLPQTVLRSPFVGELAADDRPQRSLGC
jgi:tetratricopeptide (TPR) repeat protein